MSPENIQKLRSTFPTLIGPETVILCHDGWFALVFQTFESISEVQEEFPGTSVRAKEIMEKFGQLYLKFEGDDLPEKVQEIVVFAISFSQLTCEVCGSTHRTGKRFKGWEQTLCEACAVKMGFGEFGWEIHAAWR